LIVCGYHGRRAQNDATWHALVCRALIGTEHCEERSHPAGQGTVHRFRVTKDFTPPPPQAVEAGIMQAVSELPASLRSPLPPSEALPRPLSPSGASALIEETREPVISGRSPVLDPQIEPGFAIARGLVLHKLLQMLPAVPEPDRAAAAERYLDRAA